ncbi:hypothetical protein E4U42_005095 [Claviceps africana]|uniref:VPS9 domain-containing protein n=1 Tax=Claviceps africana TaxID=83212 RepID=A0A8K0JD75_9HYPO|nr:hypothetical protein E4U42_005095 [Claviceps africana]
MQPLNPFLAAFFKSSTATQCTPVQHHVLLVPLTDVLLTWRDTDSGAVANEAVASEEFLGSHVLRIPPPYTTSGGKDGSHNLREFRGKAKQFSTLNGRSVVIKDSVVYSNKGTWEEIKIPPAILVSNTRPNTILDTKKKPNGDSAQGAVPKKKDIRSFHDLLNNFPMIARQMQPGLEKLFAEFTAVLEKPLPPPPSSSSIPDPKPDGPITAAMKRARSNSFSARTGKMNSRDSLPVTEDFYAEDDEDVMRASLETAVTAAIDLFQSVDKQQLSLLGATTDLTGPLVEKLIERYVAENVNHFLFPRISALRRPEDLELEAKIRQMEFIDISQLGIAIEGGSRAKHDLLIQLGPAIEEFKKISSAMSPVAMMDTLLSTTKAVSRLTGTTKSDQRADGQEEAAYEKAIVTVNADTLVSLLLYVVIRSQVRNLHARLLYIRNFIFIDDVDSGEMGYALSTFEAVLAYLALDSTGLRRASRRNKSLWDAAKKSDLTELRKLMEPDASAIAEDNEQSSEDNVDAGHIRRRSFSFGLTNGSSGASSLGHSVSDRFSDGSGLSHVFPFQASGGDGGDFPPVKRVKRVAMDTRSLSSGSEISFHSRTGSIGTLCSALEGDTSVERLAQTSNSFGESILMMAIQSQNPASLEYLFSLSGYYSLDVLLQDMNNEDTTLLSAAVQLGHMELVDMLLGRISALATEDQMVHYLAEQDIWGRSVGHYLFHAPSLITRIGKLIPWRQRDNNGQTPLFAMCRSYDNENYYDMVETGLKVARDTQNDGQALHLDDHVDAKGNTLLHIMNDPRLAMRILHYCDVDVNATNEKKFTALMVASKYGRYDMVRCLFADPRVDVNAKELRGLTAVELAKDDEVRNRIDDLGLFAMPAGRDGRITGVVRAFFVEDGSVRLVLKSAAPTDHDSYTVTTSRRSLADFEQLAQLLAEENPASWIPSMSDIRSPFQIPVKPSRAILRDIQARTDWFLRIMLSHPTLSTHEMLWEFFLVPELQLGAMAQRTKLKAETRVEKIKEEYEPVRDIREVEQFVNHAREMVRSVNYSTKAVTRRANGLGLATCDLYDSLVLLHRSVSALRHLPRTHVTALETYVRAMAPTQSSPQVTLHNTLVAIQSTVQALLSSLARPATLIGQITAARREADKHDSSASRPSRWPLGLLDDTRQRIQEGKEKRAKKYRQEAQYLAKELRYTQQTVAAELAGWQDMHGKMARRAIKDFATGMVVLERMKLEGMIRALRKVQPDGSKK